jgi:hypothetical protein
LNVRRIDKYSILLPILIFSSAQCWAEVLQQIGAAKIATEYESNPAMSPANPGDVRRVLFEPSYSLMSKIGENELTTGLALQISRSSNETLSPNRDSPSVFLNWRRQSEIGEVGVSTRYAEIATRDATADATGAVSAASTRASRTVSGRWSNALSERSTLSIEGIYERVSFAGGNYIDYATRSGSMMFNYAWSENSTPFLQMSHAEYEPANSIVSSTFTNTVLAGLNWRSSESLDGSLAVEKSRVGDAEVSTQGTVSVRHTGQRNRLSLSVSRQVLPSGLGGFVTADQANGSWSYALSEHSNTGIDLGWQQTHLPAADIGNRTSGVWLQHSLSSSWDLRTYYQMRNILNGGVAGDASSYILGVSLAYSHTNF